MAWNEPGGNDNDPWGNRKDSGGPPDLDEVFKNLKGQFGGLFGKKGGHGGGGGRRPAGLNTGMIKLGIGLLFVLWLISGIYIIQPAEQGVVTQFGAYKSTQGPGFHWLARPIQSVTRIDVKRIRERKLSGNSMLTNDENIVDLDVGIQYRVKSAEDFLFRVRDPEKTVEEAMESALREVIGQTNMDPLLTTETSLVSNNTHERVQEILDNYGAGVDVTAVNVGRAQPPEPVQAAFSDAIKAREDRERFINEAEAYRNEILPQARGEAQQALEESRGYKARVEKAAEGESARFTALLTEYEKAPEITRDRLYLETMESVMSNTSKVMVEGNSSNSLMYLPIDKLIDPARARAREVAPSLVDELQQQLDSLPPDLRVDPRALTRTRPTRSTER